MGGMTDIRAAGARGARSQCDAYMVRPLSAHVHRSDSGALA